MRLSEFRRAVAEEFGDDYGRTLARDLVLDGVGFRTADDALEAGVGASEVWSALCAATGVPVARRHGRGGLAPGR